MLGGRKTPQPNGSVHETNGNGSDPAPLPVPVPLLTVVGDHAKIEGKFDITDSIQIECEVGGELTVGGKLVIGEKGIVTANVQTVDAVIMGVYEGNMVATGNVEIATTGRATGNIRTDSLVISRGGFFNGNIVKINDVDGAGKQVSLLEQKAQSSLQVRGNDGRGIDGRSARVPYVMEEER